MSKRTIIKEFDNSGTRSDVRRRVVKCFMLEAPGTGRGDLVSKYDYVVKVLSDGEKVILTRPANLKNGFDFLIRVESIDFSNGDGRCRDYPKHDDILEDLKAKKLENPVLYQKLYLIIKEVYECKNVSDERIEPIRFSSGYESDMIVHVIKWFFIEQDIRYWNYSGRDMFMSGIPAPE